MNFAVDVIDALPPSGRALVWLARDGTRHEWSFGEVSERSARMAGALRRRGVGEGDVVMTLIGNRPEWVFTMMACLRIGAVVLPATEQLRAKDLRLRIAIARPALIVADERNRSELEGLGPTVRWRSFPMRSCWRASPAPAAELDVGVAGVARFHEWHGRRAEGGRPRSALLLRSAASGLPLARRARGRARVVHGGQRLVEVRAKRVHRAVADGGLCASARRAL